MKKVMKWLPIVLGIVFVAGVGVASVHADDKKQETIFEGVYINGISVGGMTEDEVGTMLNDSVQQLLSKNLIIKMGNRYLEISPEELGLKWMNPSVYKEAYNVGRCGNLIKRFKEQKDLDTASVELRTVFVADETLLRTLLEEKKDKFSVDPVNWSMLKKGNEVTYIEGSTGTLMDLEGSFNMLVDYFANVYWTDTETPELVYTVAEPLGSAEELAKVKDKLGSFTTSYAGSVAGRCQNVENGASKINGTLLYPGEEFSVYKWVAPFTVENGYGIGFAQVNGESVESIGGGICQVSTTLYNAVIRAEMEITERATHSMIVKYVKPAEDAAIAGDYKDLKFVNNLEYPIYIEGITNNQKLTFNIYGVETRSADRKVQFESEIIEEIGATLEIKEVEKPIGYINCRQEEHIGYKAYLWKIVTENGKEVSREKFNTSKYSTGVGKYDVGITSDNPEAVAAIKAAIKEAEETKDIEVLKEAVKYWSPEEVAKRENGTVTDTEEDAQNGAN